MWPKASTFYISPACSLFRLSHLWRSVLNKALPYANVVIHDRLGEDLGVVLRLLDVGVTNHTAHVLDAAALGEHVGGEGVAKVGLLLG